MEAQEVAEGQGKEVTIVEGSFVSGPAVRNSRRQIKTKRVNV